MIIKNWAVHVTVVYVGTDDSRSTEKRKNEFYHRTQSFWTARS